LSEVLITFKKEEEEAVSNKTTTGSHMFLIRGFVLQIHCKRYRIVERDEDDDENCTKTSSSKRSIKTESSC
jgi:hypothetical protein